MPPPSPVCPQITNTSTSCAENNRLVIVGGDIADISEHMLLLVQ
ncbi:MAG TPA: hypothetical protein VE076_06170 [Nitrososphaeraceae archaeon]|nr:hypothetical protein [Nitrososphaeraceae archaeon]